MQSSQLSHPKYRADIDGLRAIAILAVLGFHAFPSVFEGGFAGVDVFFVISGFLISTIIFESFRSNNFSFWIFFSRRIRRIFPSLAIVMIFCLAFGWFALFASEYEQLGKHIAGGAGFISNFILWKESGYFDAAADSKQLLHLWSLGIEEQFYIFWPILIGILWSKKVSLRNAIFWIAGFSFIINIFLIYRDPTAAFYSPQARAWELLAGAALAYDNLFSEGRVDFKKNANLWSSLGILLIFLGIIFLNGKNSFPGWALLPTIGSFLVIAAGPEGWVNKKILSKKILVWFGLISFPLYLWHWPLLSFANVIKAHEVSTYLRFFIVGISVLLAWATFHFIEKPLRFAKNDRQITFVLIGLMVSIAGIGKIFQIQEGLPFRAAEQNSKTKSEYLKYESLLEGWSECSFVKVTDRSDGGCKILRPNKEVDVAVIGDSHAGHLASGLKEIFSGRKENIAIFMYAGCYPLYPKIIDGKRRFECPDNFIEKSFDYVASSPAIKTVILSGYAALKIQGHRLYEDIDDPQQNENTLAFEEGMTDTLSRLLAAGKKIIFLTDIPELKNDPKGCLVRPYFPEDTSHYCSVLKKDFLNRTEAFRTIVGRLQEKFKKVQFIDTSNAFCNDDKCLGVGSDGVLFYASQDHLTPVGSKVLMGKIAPQIFKDLN